MKKEEYVYNVFENVAEGYDAANNRISLGLHRHWKRRAMERTLAAVPPEGRLLDLCCGTGDMTALALEMKPGLRVTGLDFSPAMLAQAEKRLGRNSRVELIRGDAMALPFPDGSFDGAIISFALRNTADYQNVLEEMVRVVKPGGSVCCIDSFRPLSPIIRPFYDIYFSVLMPLLGGGKEKFSEYRWLCRSTREFVSPSALRCLMERSGLEKTVQDSFLFGSCVSLCAQKEVRP